MKRLILKFAASALMAALFISCSTDDPIKPSSGMSGQVNGMSFNTASVNGVSQSFQFYVEGNTGTHTIKLSTNNPAEEGSYALNDPYFDYNSAEVTSGIKVYKTKNSSGIFNVTYVESEGSTVKRLVGDFNFTAYNGTTDSVVVSNGKVDFRY